ncbi:hypothetical protein ANO11243_061710 [Dothideomycetidae sp. 11243]|nr:hypothetical protein ANO11243_061710 [fungal sp. No.11243]
MVDLSIVDRSLGAVDAPEPILVLLKHLHRLALTEPPYKSTDGQPASVALERFVALDPDKCAFLYSLLRCSQAHCVVEAGTSFGLSTIHIALAVGQNAEVDGRPSKVIATENEPVKAARARQHWAKAGKAVEDQIELREGDLLETLKHDLPESIDCLFLDIWCVLALPTLKLVLPRLRIGASVIADNVLANEEGYADFMTFLQDPESGFRTTTLPYEGGLELAIYVGRRSE